MGSTVKTIVDSSKDQKRTETSRSFSSEGAFSSFCHSESSGSSIQNPIVLENVRDLRESCEDHKTHLHDKLDLKTDLDRDCSSGNVSTMTTKNNYEDNIEHPSKISSPTLSEDCTINLYSDFTKEKAMPQQHTTKEKLVEKATADTDTKFSSVINANFANTYYHNQALKEVEYQCSSCRNVYSSKQKLNPWWALVKERCPDCGESQIPRIDITSQQNQIDCHPALLAEEGEEENEDEDLEAFSIDLNYTRGNISMEDSVVSKKDNTKTVLSRTENLEDNVKKDRGDGTERIGMTGIAIHNGSLAEVEETNALNPAQAAQLLVLISHARTCSGKHESFGQREICRATKFLMLHIRDCDGKLLDGSDCCFSWCKPCKNLLTHLVSCSHQENCTVCNPKDLPSKLDELKAINSIRSKLALDAKQNLMETVARSIESKSLKIENSQLTGTSDDRTTTCENSELASIPTFPFDKKMPSVPIPSTTNTKHIPKYPITTTPIISSTNIEPYMRTSKTVRITNQNSINFLSMVPQLQMQNPVSRVSRLEQTVATPNLFISNQFKSGILPQKGTVGETTTSISNASRGESQDNVRKRKRKASINKEDKKAKKMKNDLPTCPIVLTGKKTSFSDHLDAKNAIYNNFTNFNNSPYDNHENVQPLNRKENSEELQLPSQFKIETVTNTGTIAQTKVYQPPPLMMPSNTATAIHPSTHPVNDFNKNTPDHNNNGNNTTKSIIEFPLSFDNQNKTNLPTSDSSNSLYALSYSRNNSCDTFKDLIESYTEHGGDLKNLKGENRLKALSSSSLNSLVDIFV